jgi:hypothetical protein
MDVATFLGKTDRSNRGQRARWDRTLCDGVVVFAASLLIAGSVLKWFLAAGPAERNIAADRVLSASEWLVGFWLLSDVAAWHARRVALALFGAFCVATLAKVISGEASCGCFGGLAVAPLAMFFVDAAMVAGLAWACRHTATAKRLWPRRLLLGCGFLGPIMAAASATRAIAPIVDAPQSGLAVMPSEISLGEVPRGGRLEARFMLLNRSNADVEIARIERSCACLELCLAMRRLPPGGRAEGKLRLDLGREPGFSGRLRALASGLDKKQRAAFVIAVRCRVR